MSVRMSKIRCEKILVRRKKPVETVYIRSYPKDYKLYKQTGDFKYIHPNKLKTWIAFAEAAMEARGKSFEDVIDNVIKRMKGKKFKEDERKPILLSEEEIIKLKIQALNKGIDPTWVSILCRRKRKIEKIEDVEKKRWAKILLK